MKLNTQCGRAFYSVFKKYEYEFALSLNFQTNEQQIEREYANNLAAAKRNREHLGQIHLFVLAHVLRRPIICYGVRSIKSLSSDEELDYTSMAGIYLPILFWDQNRISRTPICVAYTRFHFSALVNGNSVNCYETGNEHHNNDHNRISPDSIESLDDHHQTGINNPPCALNSRGKCVTHSKSGSYGPCKIIPKQKEKYANHFISRDLLLPLMDSFGQLLALPYVKMTMEERTNDEYYKAFLTQYLDIVESDAGIFCAVQATDENSIHHSRMMVNDWLGQIPS